MRILNPTAYRPLAERWIQGVGSIHGKHVAFLDDGWPSWRFIIQTIERSKERYQISRVSTWRIPTASSPPAGLLEKVAANCDVVIGGLGN